ncbi:MAG: MBL fold metallo-hydrolase [Candidatus Hodarchaeota archaeon]
MTWREVVPGIFSIRERSYFFFQPHVNIYYIPCNKEGGLLYDAGYGMIRNFRDFIRSYIDLFKCLKEKAIIPRDLAFKDSISRIILSHEHHDHASGAIWMKRYFPRSKILASRLTKKLIDLEFNQEGRDKYSPGIRDRLFDFFYYLLGINKRVEVDEYIEGGDTIKCGEFEFKAIDAPGHSRGQLLFVEKKHGILFSSDLVLKNISTWLGPPHSNYDHYMSTMHKLASLKGLKVILPAHGNIMENPNERIQELIRFRKLRELQIIRICTDKPCSIRDIAWKIYKERGVGTFLIAQGMVNLVTNYLVRNNRLKEVTVGSKRKFQAV